MPGPGGGHSSGGGFGGGSFGGGGRGFSGGGGFGGGSFGGSNRGGSFGGHHHHHHGPHHHGPHHHRHYGGWGWGPFYGGCGGNIISVVVILLFIAFGVIWFIAEPAGYITVNGNPVYIYEDEIVYDEATMQDYANEQYKEIFGKHSNYEDNILLVFLSNEQADGYYTIAWVGDNIKSEINEMFGEYTEYGEYMSQYINTNYYAYTLDMNLADVVNAMTKSISELNAGSSFRVDNDHSDSAESRVINYDSRLDVTKEIVNDALQNFTKTTGIPCVIVIDTVEKVFGGGDSDEEYSGGDMAIIGSSDGPTQVTVARTGAASNIFIIVALIAVGVLIAVTVAKSKKKKKPEEKSQTDIPWES